MSIIYSLLLLVNQVSNIQVFKLARSRKEKKSSFNLKLKEFLESFTTSYSVFNSLARLKIQGDGCTRALTVTMKREVSL